MKRKYPLDPENYVPVPEDEFTEAGRQVLGAKVKPTKSQNREPTTAALEERWKLERK